jgi:hypothetical protein
VDERRLPDLDPTGVPGLDSGQGVERGGDATLPEELDGPAGLPGAAPAGGGGPVSGTSAGRRVPGSDDPPAKP